MGFGVGWADVEDPWNRSCPRVRRRTVHRTTPHRPSPPVIASRSRTRTSCTGTSARGVELQLEYDKPEILLNEWGVRSTIVVFGSARIPSPERARAIRKRRRRRNRPEPLTVALLQRHLGYYQASLRVRPRIASERGGLRPRRPLARQRDRHWRRARRDGSSQPRARRCRRSHHRLQHQPARRAVPQPLHHAGAGPSASRHFGMRKMHMALRTNALVVFPGGFGTLDELFELITPQQTGKTLRARRSCCSTRPTGKQAFHQLRLPSRGGHDRGDGPQSDRLRRESAELRLEPAGRARPARPWSCRSTARPK